MRDGGVGLSTLSMCLGSLSPGNHTNAARFDSFLHICLSTVHIFANNVFIEILLFLFAFGCSFEKMRGRGRKTEHIRSKRLYQKCKVGFISTTFHGLSRNWVCLCFCSYCKQKRNGGVASSLYISLFPSDLSSVS